VYEVILKRFDHPDEIRTFEKGKFELVRNAQERGALRRLWISVELAGRNYQLARTRLL
jgi:hypothetical protein